MGSCLYTILHYYMPLSYKTSMLGMVDIVRCTVLQLVTAQHLWHAM